MVVHLQDPVVRRRRTEGGALEAALRARVQGEVRFDAGTRATYSTDASNYREVPIGVVVPFDVDDAVAAIAVCHEHDAPVLSRGGGTNLAGSTTNTAVVIDWTKYCHRLVSLDVDARTAVVEPGVALDPLNDQLAPHGLKVGPKPSTHVSCSLGGMIGNNSCGSTAQAYGKMVDSVRRLEVLTHDGERFWCGPTDDQEYAGIVRAGGRRADIYRRLREIRDEYADDIRAGFPDIPRRVSGYNLDSLLPENGFDVAKALVGSESTLVTVLHAEIDLFPTREGSALVVLGYPDVVAAARDVPAVVAHGPAALEGVDQRLVELERRESLSLGAIAQLPEGQAWLLAQFSGDDQDAADRAARVLVQEFRARDDGPSAELVDEPVSEEQLWEAREAGLAATAYPPLGRETHPGWEDAAVAPDRLGDYLSDYRGLLERYGFGSSAIYGHFGQGCVHCRIPFDLGTADGIRRYREFVEEAARLVASYGGSLSGEHGDGQARGELLPVMFGDRVVEAFGEVKALFDPRDRMNPGKVVHPRPVDTDLRQGVDYRPWQPETWFDYPDDAGKFSNAAARCVGIGKCRGDESGVMCPSYRATREEEHSTRGRARVLFEMLQGDVITDGWRSEEVRDALDLCLACKGCKSDCPVSVDMTTYKAEFLTHHYAGRPWRRPLAHWSMGWLPVWAHLATLGRPLARAVNAVTATPGLDRVVKALGGVAQQREVPAFAEERFTDWFRARPAVDRLTEAPRGRVLLWPDTFTDHFHPAIARAALDVLEDAGFEVTIPATTVCCGLTWISTGQLPVAQRVLQRTLDVLRPQLHDGTPIVVLEPSCAATFRSDLPELMAGDEDAHRLAGQTVTLAELLAQRAPDWRPGTSLGRNAIVQPHCHQHAIMGTSADRHVMGAAGLDAEILDAGCCGLAGNFGFEVGHYDVSMACAEDKLLPRIREAEDSTLVLADGFSCRTQIAQSGVGRTPVHLAEVLAAGVRGRRPGAGAGADLARRPGRGGPGNAGVLVAGATGAAVAAAAAVRARRRRRRSVS
jgi:FAD/FMN-containing dehydrogenase/Fe-S oxidoreductase